MNFTKPWQKGILLIGLNYLSISTDAVAQIQPDQSLKHESSTVVPAIVHQLPATRIEGGAIRGVNLFHSFQDFNVLELQRVYFANPQGIANIFSRVTGANPSQILGTMGVEGTANLFFLNPNGILFGKNAVLDIQGSFFATTASAFTFPNGEQFSATQPEAAPLLTLNIKPGLQYGNTPPGTIENLGKLKVGQDLTLAGGNLTLQGELQAGGNLTLQAIDTLTIRDTATTPFLALSQGEIIIQGDQNVDIYTLNHPQSGFYSGSHLTLRSHNPISADTHFWVNGNMSIEKLDGSLNDWISKYDPVLISTGDVEIKGYVGPSLHILAGGKVTVTGNITITGAGTISDTISPSSSVPFFQQLANTFPLPDGTVIDGYQKPVLDIRSGIDWAEIGGIPAPYLNSYTTPLSSINFSAQPITGSDISIQNVMIQADNGVVSLTNQYFANPTLSGNITANQIQTIAPNNSGSVFISSQGNVTLSDIVDTGSNLGDAGAINISANDTINTKDLVTNSIHGNGGDIYLQSKNTGIDTTNITLDTISQNGTAGNVEINTKGNLSLGKIATDGQLGGQISLNSTNGNITIQEQTISSGSVSKSSTDTGGTISLKANEIRIKKSLIYTGTGEFSTAKAGNIEIEANKIEIIDKNTSSKRGGLITQSNGAGNAGDITIKTGKHGSVLIQDGAEIRTSTVNSGHAGSINIVTGNLTIKNDETLNVSGGIYANTVSLGADQTGNAGNININAKSVDLIAGYIYTNTDRTAKAPLSATLGDAGNLTLKADTLSLRNGSIVTVNSNSDGNAGKITLNTRQTEVVGENAKGDPSIFVFNGFEKGSPGVFEFNGETLSLREGGYISGSSGANTVSENPGILRINATKSVEINGKGSGNQSSIVLNTSGKTNAGDLQFNTQKLLIENGGQLSAQTIATGNSGILAVNAEEIIISGYHQNPSRIIFNSQGNGNAGQLLLNSKSVTVNNGGQILAETSATGQGGTLQINTSQSVTVSGSNSQINFNSSGTSQAGGIQINTPQLSVSNNGQISVNGTGTGSAGSLLVNSSNVAVNQGGKISGSTQSSTGGNLIFKGLSNLDLQENGEISTSTIDGTGGTISIQSNRVNLNQNSRISARAIGQGSGGNIDISMGDLILENGSQIAVDSQGSGTGGNINVQGTDILMRNGSRLQATTVSGNGGNINLSVAKSIQLRYNSDILTRAQGSGNGGNMTLNAGLFILAVLSENSNIIASSTTGTGGNINANATAIFGFRLFNKIDTPESDFTASSEFGVDGTIDIDTRDLQATPLPENPGLPRTAEGCAGRINPKNNNFIGSQFINTHYGGIAPNMMETVGNITGVLPLITLEEDSTDVKSYHFGIEYHQDSQVIERVLMRLDGCSENFF